MDVGVPMWIVYLILPISGFMFLLRFIDRIGQVIVNKGDVKHDNPLV
jgi:C4-dicarboxylate transporter DctQ subunit